MLRRALRLSAPLVVCLSEASVDTLAHEALCLLQRSATLEQPELQHDNTAERPSTGSAKEHDRHEAERHTIGKRLTNRSLHAQKNRRSSKTSSARRGGPAPAPAQSNNDNPDLVNGSSGLSGSISTSGFCALVGATISTLIGMAIGGNAFGMRAGMATSVTGGVLGAIIGILLSGGISGVAELTPGTHEQAEPYTEKLHELAAALVAITNAALSSPEALNATFKASVQADLDLANTELARIEEEIEHGLHATPEDFHTLEEILSHSKYAQYFTAEAAAKDEALITAHDGALIEAGDDLDKLEQSEDIGPAGNLDAYEGDMVPGNQSEMELFRRHSMGRNAGALWTDGAVYYCFAPDVPVSIQHLFEAATKEVSNAVPCLTFFNAGHASGSSYVAGSAQTCGKSPAIFVQSNKNEGCYSYVGMVKQWQSQKLNLQYPGCNQLGTAVHELLHALGVAHEQARTDRDNHVAISWTNIQGGMEYNFEINNKEPIAINYDMQSNMHYDAFAFAVQKQTPTILDKHNPAHTQNEMGNRIGLSESDVKQLEAMYTGVASTDCYSNPFAGLGCLDKPNKDGKNYCAALTACTADAVSDCCGCGGGVAVQCYAGSPCPKADPLPPPAGGGCITDESRLFAGNPCVFKNKCPFQVKWKCPGFDCTHTTDPGGLWTANCGPTQQTLICLPDTCDVWKA